MIKLILKNLWARRRRNGWLLAELILVSIVSWSIFDPVIVLTHDRNLPLGYDADRLCLISFASLRPEAPDYDPQAQDSSVVVSSFLSFIHRVKTYPDVELTTPVLGNCFPNSMSSSSSQCFAEGDTVPIPLLCMDFLPHTQFFETYGFRPGKGMTPEQLSDYNYAQNDVVTTMNALEKFFDTQEPHGKRFWNGEKKDAKYKPIIGAVETFKAYSEWRPASVLFQPIHSINASHIPGISRIAVRLKKDVSMEHFLHEFRPWVIKELRGGNLFARDVKSYAQLIADHEYSGATSLYRRNLAMAAFFLINLCLGVIGTFWLQTRTRREEVGVMLSFGGTPGYIVRLLMGEGIVLTFVAVLTGCLIYLQYALKEGLNPGSAWMESTETYWLTDFTGHFLIVSAIIFLIMLAVVLIGIYIPARKISRIPPTEALRDE